MSYSKLVIRYHEFSNEAQKKKTILLNKKVKDFGDKNGYHNLVVGSLCYNIRIFGYSSYDLKNLLMEKDINSGSLEFISSIDSYEWRN